MSCRPSPGLDNILRIIWWVTSKLEINGSGVPSTSFWYDSSFQWA